MVQPSSTTSLKGYQTFCLRIFQMLSKICLFLRFLENINDHIFCYVPSYLNKTLIGRVRNVFLTSPGKNVHFCDSSKIENIDEQFIIKRVKLKLAQD